MVGDELVAIDRQRVRSTDDLTALLSPDWANQEHCLLVCRDQQLRELLVTPAPVAIKAWALQSDPDATDHQLQVRQRWLALQVP